MRKIVICCVVILVAVMLAMPVYAGQGKGSGNSGSGHTGSAGAGKGSGGGNGTMGNSGVALQEYLLSLATQELDQTELDGLMYMYEEEKLARDLYLALGEVWSDTIFFNIARSEQKHMDAVAAMFGKYDLTPPEDDGQGVFSNEDLQGLYTALLLSGDESLAGALHVGATVEDVDVYDLQDYLGLTDNEDVSALYQNLMKGSRNHLRAYVAQLERAGETYSAQSLTDQELQDILSSAMERGILDADGQRVN